MTTHASLNGFDRLRVVTSANWLAEDFQRAGVIPVVRDYGFDPPPGRAGDAIWSPGAYVNRCLVTNRSLLPPLASPDHRFLDRVPQKFTRRLVVTRTVADWRNAVDPGEGFVKVPLMKQALFPAQIYASMADALAVIDDHYQATSNDLVEQMLIQHSTVISFVREYRCFVADRKVTATSFYLEVERGADGTVTSETTWQSDNHDAGDALAEDAAVFAATVIHEMEHLPAGFTLDVGQLPDGTWAVVEANAAWSSNPYNADTAGAIVSILASQRADEDGMFLWDPELAYLARVSPFRE